LTISKLDRKNFDRERIPIRWKRHKFLRNCVVCESDSAHSNKVLLQDDKAVKRFLEAQRIEQEKLQALQSGRWQ
jgi:hypothetical protein